MLAVVPIRNHADAGGVFADVTAALHPSLDPLFTPEQVAGYLGLDVTTVRRRFVDLPGVMVMGRTVAGRKRSYTTIRIPLGVLKTFVQEHKR